MGVLLHDPRVVVVREQVHLGLRQARLEVGKHRRGEQQIAELVALKDEDLHAP